MVVVELDVLDELVVDELVDVDEVVLDVLDDVLVELDVVDVANWVSNRFQVAVTPLVSCWI